MPWATFVIMALCFLIHFIVDKNQDKVNNALQNELTVMIQYFVTHPYLEFDPELERLFLRDEQARQELSVFRETIDRSQLDEETVKQEQEEFNRIMGNIKSIVFGLPYLKWGFIPAKGNNVGLFTYMFLHGDWLHLIGNLLFLYLCAPFIEDAWGKLVYIPFYVLGGIFAAFMYGVHYPHFSGPLIGASGAVSAAMGAFLVRFFKTKIDFIFISFFVRVNFAAPAWLMLPLWLVMEFLNARTMDNLERIGSSGGGGVAHWAHIWGFVFGVVAALALRFMKYEEKYVNPVVEAESTFVKKSYSIYEESIVLNAEGKKEEAFAKMIESVRLDPTDSEVVEALWAAAIEQKRVPEVICYYKKLIESDIRRNDLRTACERFERLLDQSPGENISGHGQLALVEHLAQRGDKKDARDLFERTPHTIDRTTPAGKLLQYADIALMLDLELAKNVMAVIREHPDIPAPRKVQLEERLQTEISNARFTGYSSQSASVGISEGKGYGEIGTRGLSLPEKRAPNALSLDLSQPSPVPAGHFSQSEPELELEGSGMLSLNLDFGHKTASPRESPIVPPTPAPSSQNLRQPQGMAQPSSMSSPAQSPRRVPADAPRASAAPAPPLPGAVPAPKTGGGTKAFQILPVIPLGISDDRLTLKTETMGERNLPLRAIKAISTAQIAPAGAPRFLVIDLFLDDPAQEAESLRIMRMSSRQFDPRGIFPESNSLVEAYQRLLWKMLQVSRARPMPSQDVVLLKQGRSFSSMTDYEKTITPG